MRYILCIGGSHDFTARPADRALTDLMISLAGGEGSRVCLIPTASGDPTDQSSRFYNALANRECVASDVSLFRLGKRPLSLRDHLLAQDLIYVGGGSMLNLLAVWDAHDVGALLRLAWQQGTVICGQSAGAMCWFEVGISKGSGTARRAAGLGLLPGGCSVHYHSEPDRRRLLMESVASGGMVGYGIDDHAALLWTDRHPSASFSAAKDAGVYRVQRGADRVFEQALAPTVLVDRSDEVQHADIVEFRRTARATRGRIRARTFPTGV